MSTTSLPLGFLPVFFFFLGGKAFSDKIYFLFPTCLISTTPPPQTTLPRWRIYYPIFSTASGGNRYLFDVGSEKICLLTLVCILICTLTMKLEMFLNSCVWKCNASSILQNYNLEERQWFWADYRSEIAIDRTLWGFTDNDSFLLNIILKSLI